jgi:hypothetical protein
MADINQSGRGADSELAAKKARLERTLAFAEWANQPPAPSEPGTAAMTVNEMLNKIAGELARIAACYDLKEASNDFQDSAVLGGADNPGAVEYYEEAQQKLGDAMKRLGCPGTT